MIDFTCDCGKSLQAREEHAGQRTRCPDCGRELRIPEPSTAVEPGPPGRRPRGADEEYDAYEPARSPERTSGMAKASLILGLLLPCTFFTGIPAIICGILGLVSVGRSNGRLAGTGLAIAGIALGAFSSACMSPILVGLLLPAVQKVREAANRMASQNNLKQVALAVHNYHATNGCLPPAVVYDAQGKPLYSWRVLLLPYLGEGALYQQFRLEEPWDSPQNKALLPLMPRMYLDPSRPDTGDGTTTYLALTGKGTVFESDPQNGLVPLKDNPKLFRAKPLLSFKDIPDGTSNTIMIAEAADPVPWTKPEDLEYAPGRPLPSFSKIRPLGFNAAFVDGSVRWLPRTAPEQTLRALISRNGGEVINWNDL
jgi:hypothetical protein